MKPSPDPRIRLFRNRWLESFTIISPIGFILIWFCAIPAVLWVAWGTTNAVTALALLAAGLLGWSLFEYALHRFFFHWTPRWAPLATLVFIFHGNHHAMPNDPLRNLMPPIVSIPIIALVWVGSVAAIGQSGSWFLLGFVIGYVVYDLIHFASHQLAMKGKVARIIKQHHMRHHYAPQDGNYAFTGLIWDRLFRTRVKLSKD